MAIRLIPRLIFTLLLLSGCSVLPQKHATHIPLPDPANPTQVPESILKQTSQVPIFKGDLPPDTCLAVLREDSIPVERNGKLSFTDYGWSIGVECPRRPGMRCFPVDDGHCRCFEPREEEDPTEGLAFEPVTPLTSCQMVFDARRLHAQENILRTRLISCQGECPDSEQRCNLRRLPSNKPTVAGYVLGCACVDQSEEFIELRDPADDFK